MTHDRLPMRVKLGFGVCDLGGNLFFTVMAFLLLNYLTDTVGLNAGLAGIVIMIGKIWDAVTDPVAGYLSDRTRTRWGRRRPYIFLGSIPLMAAMVLMFTDPRIDSQAGLFAWGLLAFCILSTAYTLVNIPYSALTPELTPDFHERTSLNGYRFGFAIVGTLIGAGGALPLINAFGDHRTGYTVMGLVFGAIMLITAWLTVFAVREPPTPKVPREGFWETYRHVFGNRPYVWILLTYGLHVAALTIVSGIVIYYFKYLHHNEGMTTPAMLILLLSAMLNIPVSVWLARRIGKKAVYGIGMGWFAAVTVLIAMAGHLLPPVYSLVMMAAAGVGMGFTYAMPYAMVPDAVDYGTLVTGRRTEGAYYGIWTFGIKIGQALALGISGGILALAGYVPDVVQTPAAALGIRLLIGPIPAVVFGLAMVTLYRYPISEQVHRDIQEQIGRRGILSDTE